MILPRSSDTLVPGEALGRVCLPGSKSATNRALLLAALACGESRLHGVLEAEDTRWMREALGSLGIPVELDSRGLRVRGGSAPVPARPLWVGASGTTLRFLLPWLALHAEGPVDLEGEPRLFERPLDPLLDALATVGARWEPRSTGGRLVPAAAPSRLDLEVDASLSSQFLSGLAMVAASLHEGGDLHWTAAPASTSYLALTARWLQAFGCETRLEQDRWSIPGGRLRPAEVDVPADWSGAAAFLAAAAVTGRGLALGPLDAQDEQRDRDLVQILAAAGCTVAWAGAELSISGPLRHGIRADLEPCPDLGPVLAAVAALAPGPSELTGLQTLPLKECDRLEASADLVGWLGGRAEVIGNHTLRIEPGPAPAVDRPPFDPRRDHRMAFAAAVGALRCGGRLLDPGCVAKTFPTFWTEWANLLGLRP